MRLNLTPSNGVYQVVFEERSGEDGPDVTITDEMSVDGEPISFDFDGVTFDPEEFRQHVRDLREANLRGIYTLGELADVKDSRDAWKRGSQDKDITIAELNLEVLQLQKQLRDLEAS